jgi:hypothetical protein
MAIARVQAPAASSSATNVSSITNTFGSNVTAGNLLVAVGSINDATAPTLSFSSTGSPTWAVTAQYDDSTNTAQTIAIGYCQNAPGGATTVTFSFPPGGAPSSLIIAEYSGAAVSGALDQNTAGKTTAATTTPTDDAMVTTANGDLIIGAITYRNANKPVTVGAGYSLIADESTNTNLAVEDRIQASAGSIATTWTVTGGTLPSGVMSAAFKAAPALALARQAQPGRTWRRRYRHRQMPPSVSVVAPAVPEHAPIFPSQYGGYY